MSCQYEAAEDNMCSSVIVCYLYYRWTSNYQRGLISHQLIYLRHFIVPVQSLDFQRHMMLYLIMYNVLRWYDVIVRFLGIGGIVKLLFIISFQNLCAWIWNLINQITIFNMRHTFVFHSKNSRCKVKCYVQHQHVCVHWLSGTCYVCVHWLSGTCYVCVHWLSGTCYYCFYSCLSFYVLNKLFNASKPFTHCIIWIV
jgi:hypothetical protein